MFKILKRSDPYQNLLCRAFIPCVITFFFICGFRGIAISATLYVGPGETYISIQPALDAAQNGDTVIVRDGTYTGSGNTNLNFNGKGLTLHSENGPENTIIDCELLNIGFNFTSNNSSSVVDGFTIKNGRHEGYGGAIACHSSSLTINNCIFENNSSVGSSQGGGAFFCFSSTVTINGCIFKNNNATYDGGAIWWRSSTGLVTNCIFENNSSPTKGGGISFWESSPTISICTFSGNEGHDGGGISCQQSSPAINDCIFTNNITNIASGYGGGIYCYSGSSPSITSCIFMNNTAGTGGGIVCQWGVNGPSSPSISDCLIKRNNANSAGGIFCKGTNSSPLIIDCIISENSASGGGQGGSGGGIYLGLDSLSPTIINCLISNNAAKNQGGGIYCYKCSEPTITECTIFRNTAGNYGGGICSYNSIPIIDKCTIKKNKVNLKGSGIFLERSPANIAIRNSLITGNKSYNIAEGSGAIHFLFSSATIQNCTISNNTNTGEGAALYCEESSPKISNSILWGDFSEGENCEIYLSDANSPIDISYSNVQQVSGELPGLGNINEDPLFVNSEQGNYFLLSDSPCIDKGNEDNAPADDRAGIARPQGDGIDIGAYEFVDSSSCIPRASFMANINTGTSPLEVEFNASSSGGADYRGAIFLWDFGDGPSDSSGPIVTHKYAYGSHDVSLTVQTDCGSHTITLHDFIKVKSLSTTKEVGEGYPYATIQKAIDDAEDGEVIFVHLKGNISGTVSSQEFNDYIQNNAYNENINFKGKEIILKGEEQVVKIEYYLPAYGVPLYGYGGYGYYFYETMIIKPIISGGSSGRLVTFDHHEDENSVLDGFWLYGSNLYATSGIKCEYSSPTIKNCTIKGNKNHASHGGGMYLIISSPSILNCVIKDNAASHYGGGICMSQGSAPKIYNCTITNNSLTAATEGLRYGGGICCSTSSPIIKNCEITYNCAYDGEEPSGEVNTFGGGIFMQISSPTITNCIISNNSASRVQFDTEPISAHGGGIGCINSSPIISNCKITSNKAFEPWEWSKGYGSGMYYEQASSGKIVNCIISNNGNAYYGAIYLHSSSPAINNCTIFSNHQGQVHCASGSSPSITNCIIGSNTGSYGRDLMIHGDASSSPKVNYSNIWTLIQEGYPGIGNLDEDPLFLELPTYDPINDNYNFDFRLQYGSPCIDEGMQIDDLYSDIRGSLRPLGEVRSNSKFDMGAYEYSWYWGNSTDVVVKAFKDVKMLSTHALYCMSDHESEYEIQWDGMAPFPNHDLRLTQPLKYKVNIILVSEDQKEVDLVKGEKITTDISAMTPEGGYRWTYKTKFQKRHEGTWKIRIEMTDDPQQFTISEKPINIIRPDTEMWTVGEPIDDPQDADPTQKPEFDEKVFLWSEVTKKLYPIKGNVIGATVTWKDSEDNSIVVPGNTCWPDPVFTQNHIIEAPAVNLLPEGSKYQSVMLIYTETDMESLQEGSLSLFEPTIRGYTVLAYYEFNMEKSKPEFEVIYSYRWQDSQVHTANLPWTIGQEIIGDIFGHDCLHCGNGHVLFEMAQYDADLYQRDTREGPIFVVNEDINAEKMVVIWYQRSIYDRGACWPFKSVHYDCNWPPDMEVTKIVIDDEKGAPLPAMAKSPELYIQPDFTLPGDNPNEEHALLIGDKAFALRCDLNDINGYSKPYVLVKYIDLTNEKWAYKVYKVVCGDFHYRKKAGYLIQPPYPLNTLIPLCLECNSENYNNLYNGTDQCCLDNNPATWWRDYDGNLYSRQEGSGCLYFYYPLQPTFFYDIDGNGMQDAEIGDCIPWMSKYSEKCPTLSEDHPHLVQYTICWPDDEHCLCPDDPNNCPDKEDLPGLYVGETLFEPKRGLPDITNQCSVEVIYDENDSVRLIDPLGTIKVYISDLSSLFPKNLDSWETDLDDGVIKYERDFRTGKMLFPDLPYHLRIRIAYTPDADNPTVEFKGYFDDSQLGEPLLLLNVISPRDMKELLALDTRCNPDEDFDLNNPTSFEPQNAYQEAIKKLYDLTHTQYILNAYYQAQTKLVGMNRFKALTAGDAQGTGYVTLAFANDKEICAPNPVDVEVIKVVCPLYRGEVKVIEPENAFDEKLTLRHNGDFGGKPERLIFEWWYSDSPEKPETPIGELDDSQIWKPFFVNRQEGKGAVDITIRGPGLDILRDKWFICRYEGYEGICDSFKSPWTDPQFYENWIKRVMKKINLFDQRYQDFHRTEADTYASMIKQAGVRYEGDVALVDSPEYLNTLGLIECYETVLRKGMEFSIDYQQNDEQANQALLLAASRIVDLYMLFGNEAYGDAVDPTIGFGTEDGIYGAEATSIFCFQNQLASLLDEELCLLRGRDDQGYVPVYNRLFWNYTIGQDGGEVAYSLNYNLRDENEDGFINEYDAKIMYPQGHGDAWGHYLTAIKGYYKLLRHEYYEWKPRPEYLLLTGKPVAVDYYDERKFARAASARAKCGAEIVNLTYRANYVEDPEEKWQGYVDDKIIDRIIDDTHNTIYESPRAWGVSDWASRAGQGAFLDWVTANALLPSEDIDPTHEGIQKIDRTTVLDIHAIPEYFEEIQETLDNADIGLNPLGVAKDAIPFDISPSDLLARNTTHFEQIYSRAAIALNNASDVFNYANQFAQLLRRQQDKLEDFRDNIKVQELSYTNRLIEIFGYPYEDDIGANGSYPEGYNGPDLYHYMYIDSLVDTGQDLWATVDDDMHVDEEGNLVKGFGIGIKFHLSTNLGMLVKPESWKGSRRAPGELQIALSELLQTKNRLDQALENYDNLIAQIKDQADLIKAQQGLNADEIQILRESQNRMRELNWWIWGLEATAFALKTAGKYCILYGNAGAEALPKISGAIAGTSCGVVFDITFPARSSIKAGAALAGQILESVGDSAGLAVSALHHQKEFEQAEYNIKITSKKGEFAETQLIVQLEQLIRQEMPLRLELYTLHETMIQAQRRYQATLAKGERLLQERELFRQQTADQIQDYRYKDMAFRIFRNDAIQKYRAQFDLASLYVYLAAKAYDYETTLLDSHSLAGQSFLTDIVRQRAIGQIRNASPVTGNGLADSMARLNRNFLVLKGQLGFNNPQTETSRFSLRKELFRLPSGQESDNDWKEVLESMRVSNLWAVPEIERYCIPFDSGEQPAIVIPFSSTIHTGQNFFGNDLRGGDNYFPSEIFATKIRSIGVWFSNYNSLYLLGMAQSPRVYLIPVGVDRLKVPYTFTTREWQVIDQIIPVPFRLGESAMGLDCINAWKPKYDSLSEELFRIRRHPRFRAYHDSGTLKLEEMTYDSRLIGRSVWNTRWLLVIPGASLHGDPDEGLDLFIYGPQDYITGERTGYGVTDIKIFFQTYSYPGY